MKTESMEKWFNPYSTEHMKAYENLCKTGTWPKGFVPDHIETPVLFVAHIQAKISQAWLEAVKHGNVFGVPSFDQ